MLYSSSWFDSENAVYDELHGGLENMEVQL